MSEMKMLTTLQPTSSSPADDRATDFKAVEGEGAGEHFNGFTLMVEAYAAIWLILMVWLVWLWRKQADLTTRLAGLEGAIARAEQRAGGLYRGGKPEKDAKEKEKEKSASEKSEKSEKKEPEKA